MGDVFRRSDSVSGDVQGAGGAEGSGQRHFLRPHQAISGLFIFSFREIAKGSLFEDGKTVWELGPFLVFIDKAVLFMKQSASSWVPVGLDQIFERVRLAANDDLDD